MLTEAQRVLEEAAEVAAAAVVGVGRRGPAGSGVVVAPGQVLTNAHNLRSERSEVAFADGRTEPAEVAGLDIDGDLAVLRTDTGGASALTWSDDPATLGMAVVGAANPAGRGLRVTLGFVSGVDRVFRGPRGRRISGSVEHTAPLLPGSSGGPLLNAAGAMVGLNTHRLGDGFYLALPAGADLRRRVDALAAGAHVRPVRLGVGVAPSAVARRLRRAVGLSASDGALVRTVEPGSPAASAGLREGDLIVALGGREVAGVDGLHTALEQAGPGETTVEILRGDERLELTVELASA